jgi:hypothetical protein
MLGFFRFFVRKQIDLLDPLEFEPSLSPLDADKFQH